MLADRFVEIISAKGIELALNLSNSPHIRGAKGFYLLV